MSKTYMNGNIVKPRPQPSGLAAYAARKQQQEAAALHPYTVEKEKYGRGYIVSLDGRELETYTTKAEAVAWIKQEKACNEQRPETISKNEKQEANTMNNTFTFTPDSITVKGKTFPAGYSVTPSGAVFVFVQQDGKQEKTRIRFNPDHPDYAAALSAAKNEQPAAAPVEMPAADERRETISAPAAVEETPAPAADPSPAADGKATRGPVPEKNFIGESITGNGWKILFDGETSRTRIIFESKPTDAARAALDKAGFFFSAAMNSWNKKLTFKAYRAAQALAGELSALYA